jgi:Xaa-Pro aminopeptidase
MTRTTGFTAEDFSSRMNRAASDAAEAGLTGLLVTPGPDLVYFTGYAVTAISERITMLVIQADRAPAMIVPVLERPDAEHARGAELVAVRRARAAGGRRGGCRCHVR